MYCNYWRLSAPPFENVVNPRVVYYSANHNEALLRLFYTVKSGKGACMLTGGIGCGKTTISRVFLENLNKDDYTIGFVSNPNLNSFELLQEILLRLDVQAESLKKKFN